MDKPSIEKIPSLTEEEAARIEYNVKMGILENQPVNQLDPKEISESSPTILLQQYHDKLSGSTEPRALNLLKVIDEILSERNKSGSQS